MGTPSGHLGCCTFQDCMVPAQHPGSAYPKALYLALCPYTSIQGLTYLCSLSLGTGLEGRHLNDRHHVGKVRLGSTGSSVCSAPCRQHSWRPSSSRQEHDALGTNGNHAHMIADYAISGTSEAAQVQASRCAMSIPEESSGCDEALNAHLDCVSTVQGCMGATFAHLVLPC